MQAYKWWKEGVIYQIYPRSFFDSNEDGIGDLPGITLQLDYLKSLGVDIIWLSPVYKSPNDDNGYDISDYRDIMDEFGTMDDFDRLLEEVHLRDMRLVMDLVVNHTSDEHAWFQESRSSKDNPYRDYYIWREGAEPPNNWQSFFGGSAWKYDEQTDAWYLHLFTQKQPDLNWENPKVREEVYALMRFWLDKGVDGFRMDVIPMISKRPGFPDYDYEDFNEVIQKVYANGPRVHEFLQEMHREVLRHYDIVTIGEGVGITAEESIAYVGEDRKELNMIFHFDHMFIDHGNEGRLDRKSFTLEEFLKPFTSWDQALANKAWGSLYLGNHDFPRMVSRFGDDSRYWRESATLLATLLFTLRGTPTIFQGDEIGMTNTPFADISEYRDVEMMNMYREALEQGKDMHAFFEAAAAAARDHARTPVQWTAEPFGGFSTVEPWIRSNDNFHQINVADQVRDPNSIWRYYQKLIQLRKEHLAWVYGDVQEIDTNASTVYAYRRVFKESVFSIVLNFSSEEQMITHNIKEMGRPVISNYPDVDLNSRLLPWQAIVLHNSLI